MSTRGRPKNQNSQIQIDLFRDRIEEIVQNGKLAPRTSAIYSELGEVLKKSPIAVYLAAKRHFRDIFVESDSKTSNQQDESHEDTSSDGEKVHKAILSVNIQIDKETFPFETYLKKSRRTQIVLKRTQAGWADKLFDLIWEWDQNKTKCAWTFRHSYVRSDDSIVFDGDCTECNAIFRGVTNSSRTILNVRITDYNEEYNHVKRRRMQGERRQKMIEQLKVKSAFNVHRELAAELIHDENQGMVPKLPTEGAVRQAKYESSIEDKRGAIQNILKWKNESASFRNTIGDVGCSPFFLKYQLPIQREWYINESQHRKMAISCDATGGVVIPPNDSELSTKTQKLKHIFFYNMMAKTEFGSIPMSQMLSQRHTARFIGNWIAEVFTDMPMPFEVVCDGSKALILALVNALTRYHSVKEYIRACITSLETGRSPPKCFIRLDRSHWVHSLIKNFGYKDMRKKMSSFDLFSDF